MTIDRAIELMKIEKKCVKRANICDRNCAECELVQKDEDLIAAYDKAIDAMKGIEELLDFFCEFEKLNDKKNETVDKIMFSIVL